MTQKFPNTTTYEGTYVDENFEYRIVTLSLTDYIKLPRDYRAYYREDNT